MGWEQPIATAEQVSVSTRQRGELAYLRVLLKRVRLSHASVLYLLQGASLRQLFEGTSVEGNFFSLAFAEMPRLWQLPVELDRVVLVRVLSAPEGVDPEKVLYELFLAEVDC